MIEILKCYAVNGTKQEILDEVFPTINSEQELEVYRKKLLSKERLKHPVEIMVNGEKKITYDNVEIYFSKKEK